MFKHTTNRRARTLRVRPIAETFEILERRELLSAASLTATARIAPYHPQHGGHHQLYQPMFAQAITPHTAFDQAQPYAGQSSPTGTALTPTQIRSAYGMGAIGSSSIIYGAIQGDGTGQTIAIIDAYDYPTAASDLHNFSMQYGLPDAPSFTKVNQNGQASPLPGTDPAGAGAANGTWEMEEALDIEWAHVMAPKASLVLVECNSSSSFDMIYNLNTHVNGGVAWARSQPGISVVSMSFGFGESAGETSYDQYFTTPAGHQGVTFLASTGDTGTPGGYPAYSPNVVAVGGTELSVNNNAWNNEWGWTGSGGGVSKYENQPAYQNGVVNAFSTTKRTIPDISLEADPNTGVAIYDSYDFGAATPWNAGLFGGTSLAAPMMAGITAVANQGRTLSGLDTLNGVTQTLPNIYQSSASNFHDITAGNNGTQAVAGYDTVTGRGTPIGSAFAFSVAGITADSPINNLYVKKDADGVHLDEWINSATPGQGAPTQQRVLSSASSMLLNAAAGSDAVTLDYSNGNFAAGLTNIAYFASAGASNSINFVGSVGNDGISITTGSIGVSGGFGSSQITMSNVASVSFPGGSGGNDSVLVLSAPAGGLNLNADAPFGAANIAVNVSGMMTNVNFTSTQHLASLTVQTTNSAKLTSSATNAGKLLVVPTLTIAGTGKLDLTNNELIVTSAAAAIRGEIVAGHITSTAVGGALGYMDIGNGQTEVRYTLLGDTNLDGKVDVTDLGNLASTYGAGSGATWVQGDTNYDGKVDVTDLGNLASNYGGAVA